MSQYLATVWGRDGQIVAIRQKIRIVAIRRHNQVSLASIHPNTRLDRATRKKNEYAWP